MTLLEVAADSGNVDAVQQLLKAQPGPNINHQDSQGNRRGAEGGETGEIPHPRVLG